MDEKSLFLPKDLSKSAKFPMESLAKPNDILRQKCGGKASVEMEKEGNWLENVQTSSIRVSTGKGATTKMQ
jgi:hypothetical protein